MAKKSKSKVAIKKTAKKTVNNKTTPTQIKKKNGLIKEIRKRDGKMVPFDIEKIENAIFKAIVSTGEGTRDDAEFIASAVYAEIVKIARSFKEFTPSVEGVQDIVEQQLILNKYPKTAKHYILYREERAKIRAQRAIEIPEKVRKLAADSKKYFRNPLAEFVYYRTYARWMESEGRRETWIETVDRYINFMKENLGNKLKEEEYKEVRQYILEQKAMPSMRLMQFAGSPAKKTNVCAYNCSYIAPSKLEDFAEMMYISMCGTGVGFAVESFNVQKLPQIQKQTGEKLPTHIVEDSKEGW